MKEGGLGCNLEVIATKPKASKDCIVMSNDEADINNADVDGVLVEEGVLVLNPKGKISSDRILQIRKRMATPMTSPVCFGKLESMANQEVKNGRFGTEKATEEAQKEFY